MKVVLIIGVEHHGYQVADYCGLQNGSRSFQQYLTALCIRCPDVALSEEMPADGLANVYHGATTCAKRVAEAFGRRYLQFDLTSAERAEAGIPPIVQVQNILDQDATLHSEQRALRKLVHGPREDEWVNRIVRFDTFPLCTICGSKHVLTLRKRLGGAGIRTVCAARRWTPSTKLRLPKRASKELQRPSPE